MQQLAYEKLMADNQITLEELPTDAKSGIKEIKQVIHALNMTEQRGQKVNPATIEKIKRLDKALVREIVDYMEETEESTQGNQMNSSESKPQQSLEEKANFDEGIGYENEMEGIHKSGKSELSIDELKSMAPKCYKKIFATYEDGQPNGIKTSKYTLIENQTNPKTFNLN